MKTTPKTTKTATKTTKTAPIIKNYYVSIPPIDALSGYGVHGATSDPDLGWAVSAGTPRADIDDALPRLRARARDLYVSSALISAAINTRAAGAVGAGLRLDAQPAADVLGLDTEQAARYDRLIETTFARWATRAGAGGETLAELTQAAALACLMSGDVFLEVSISGRSMRLSLIEGDRVETPFDMAADRAVCHGVHTARSGAAIAYYVNEGDAWGDMTEYTRRPAFRPGYYNTLDGLWMPPRSGILHLHMPFERPGQRRGIPAAARVLIDAQLLDKYKTAEVNAAGVAANAALLITHPSIEAAYEVDAADSFSGSACEPEQAITHPGYTLKPGAVFHLEPGADVRSFNTNRPNTAFSAFCDAVDARICAALGLPAEVVQRRYEASYSASRAARLDADQTYRLDRARIVSQMLRPIFCAWLDLNADELGLSGYYESAARRAAWQSAEFLGESVPSIDPEKEVKAALEAIAGGLSTRAREARILTGMDTQTIIRVLAEEERAMRAAGLVKDQNGNPIKED